MSVPGRLHITWQDDSTLKVETDAGMQTRLLQLRRHQRAPRRAANVAGRLGRAMADAAAQRAAALAAGRANRRCAGRRPTGGSLRVVTTNLRAGYLRKNGVPYSENAVLTEHWDLYKRPNGEEWLTITTQVDDPQYLRTREARRAGIQEGTERRQMGSDSLLGAMVVR